MQLNMRGLAACLGATLGALTFTVAMYSVSQPVEAAGKNVAPTVSLTSPAANSTYKVGNSIPLTANASDSDGTVTKVEFFHSGTQLIGTDSTAPSPFGVSWAPATPGTYSLTAKATDNGGAFTTSSAITVTVLANAAPTVSITSPSNGAGFAAPATIAIAVSASDSDGSVSKIDIFQGATLLQSIAGSSGAYNWSGVAAGNYALTAKATDNSGAVATSPVVTVNVGAAPIVVLRQPENCFIFTPLANISLSADALDTTGWIKKVEFYAGSVLIGTATRKPYNVSWNSVPSGNYTVTARATNNMDLTGDSLPISIKVETPNTPSTVQITQPASGANVLIGSTVTISASASDPDGIAQVIFKENGIAINPPSTSAPYSVQWVVGGVPSVRTLSATVIDNRGAPTSSQNLTVNAVANAIPTANLTAPANNSSYRAPATVVFNATASDSDGNVTQAELLLDGVPSGPALLGAGPYSGNLTNLAAGTHTVQIRVKDNVGAFGLSNISNINVAANALPAVQISSPVAGAAFNAPASIAITATASDSDGSIAKVDFLADGVVVGSSTGPTYAATWSGAALGAHTLTAVATDNDGGTRTSAAVPITVNGVTALITAPNSGASFVAPASFNITATATTTSGGITSVDLIEAGNTVSSIPVPPGNNTANVTFTMAGIAAGSHGYTVFARDGAGRTAVSSVITVNVAPAPTPPSISLTAPGPNAFFIAPAQIRLIAEPAGGSSTVAKVDFYAGQSLIATVTAGPYTFSWTNVAAGTYTFTARVTDAAGMAVTSNPVTATVGTQSMSIDSPLNGATVSGGYVLVQGTVQSTPNTGITLNGRVAALDADGKYYLRLPLTPGPNTIIARAKSDTGQVITREISIVSDGLIPPVRVDVENVEGPYPLTAIFTVVNDAATDVAVNVNGTLVGSVAVAQTASFPFTVNGPASIPVTVIASTGSQQLTSASFVLVAHDPVRLDNMLRSMWSGMSAALAMGDKAAALSYLPSAGKAKYGPLFDVLMPSFPSIFATFSSPATSSLSANSAEYIITRSSSGTSRAYFVYFVRGSDGVWRIDEM